MKEQLKAFLALEGYTTVVSNLPEFLVFLKKEYRHVSAIFAIELEEHSTFTKERYKDVYDSACKLLEKNGITEMHILTLVISDDQELALEVCEDDKYAWVIKRSSRELLIGGEKAADFYGMKTVLQRFLDAPEAALQRIKETEEKILDDLKAREKQLKKSIYVPWAAYTLVALNIVVYIVCTATGDLLYNMGEMSVANTIYGGQWYRIITSMFLHGNLAHILNNMLILYLLGNMVEKRVGRWQFLVYYFVCGIVAGLVSLGAKYFSGIDANSIGASGAVYGIFGIALITEFVTINWRRVKLSTVRRMALVVICIFVSLYADARMDGVDYEAHVGGLCMGAILGLLWYLISLRKIKEKKHED